MIRFLNFPLASLPAVFSRGRVSPVSETEVHCTEAAVVYGWRVSGVLSPRTPAVLPWFRRGRCLLPDVVTGAGRPRGLPARPATAFPGAGVRGVREIYLTASQT